MSDPTRSRTVLCDTFFLRKQPVDNITTVVSEMLRRAVWWTGINGAEETAAYLFRLP
jgi:hypothetical protein